MHSHIGPSESRPISSPTRFCLCVLCLGDEVCGWQIDIWFGSLRLLQCSLARPCTHSPNYTELSATYSRIHRYSDWVACVWVCVYAFDPYVLGNCFSYVYSMSVDVCICVCVSAGAGEREVCQRDFMMFAECLNKSAILCSFLWMHQHQCTFGCGPVTVITKEAVCVVQCLQFGQIVDCLDILYACKKYHL